MGSCMQLASKRVGFQECCLSGMGNVIEITVMPANA